MLWMVFGVLLLIFNTGYSLLSSRFQAKKWKWVRVCAVVVALIMLAQGVHQEIDAYRSRVFAHVSSDGKVLAQRNFPWPIRVYARPDGRAGYVLDKRTDGTELSVRADYSASEPNVYGGYDGVFIEFDCTPEQLGGFEIRVKDQG